MKMLLRGITSNMFRALPAPLVFSFLLLQNGICFSEALYQTGYGSEHSKLKAVKTGGREKERERPTYNK